MNPLRKFLDSLHPLFDKGGKLEKLYPLYEGVDTFLYTPGEVTKTASHVRDAMDLKRMMITVVVALTPCIFMAMYNTGLQANETMQGMVEAGLIQPGEEQAVGWRHVVLSTLGVQYDPEYFFDNLLHGALYFIPVFLVCHIVGGLCEVIFCCIRKHELNEGFLVTGMLFPLTLPPTIPLWQVAIGIAFGVVFGKEVFGGTGKNFLNPALTARAFLYFAYPAQMTGDTIWTAVGVDGFSGATPLGLLADPALQATVRDVGVTWSQAFWGVTQGSMGETSTFACLLGAAMLITTGVGSWRVMAGVLAGGLGLSGFFYFITGGSDPMYETSNTMFLIPPHWHLVLGGFAFGLVFMATDPVSAAMTEKGKWYYGILIGVMTILVRVVNPAFPEGIMLAILFGNVFAPLIDYRVVQANIKRRNARNAA